MMRRITDTTCTTALATPTNAKIQMGFMPDTLARRHARVQTTNGREG